MLLHLIKLCAGVASIEELEAWQTRDLELQRAAGLTPRSVHRTFQTPKRQKELLNHGSLYWVIKGTTQARQRIIGLEDGVKDDGSPCCTIVLDPQIVAVHPSPRRAFQGWRYLTDEEAPADLGRGAGRGLAAFPPALRRELAALCLI